MSHFPNVTYKCDILIPTFHVCVNFDRSEIAVQQITTRPFYQRNKFLFYFLFDIHANCFYAQNFIFAWGLSKLSRSQLCTYLEKCPLPPPPPPPKKKKKKSLFFYSHNYHCFRVMLNFLDKRLILMLMNSLSFSAIFE